MKIAFVTPVYRRPEITNVCLQQRWHMAAAVAGVTEVVNVVVGEAQDLVMARELGFTAIQCENILGFKLNNGFEFAARQLRADVVCFIGSDQWLHQDYLLDLGSLEDRVRTGKSLAAVDETGTRMGLMQLPYVLGPGPKLVPASKIAPSYRPFTDTKRKSMDGDLIDALGNPHRKALQWFDLDHLDGVRYVDFKNRTTQLHAYRKLQRFMPVELRGEDVWERLSKHYPASIVEAMEKVYA